LAEAHVRSELLQTRPRKNHHVYLEAETEACLRFNSNTGCTEDAAEDGVAAVMVQAQRTGRGLDDIEGWQARATCSTELGYLI
jgi:hypothetical protein